MPTVHSPFQLDGVDMGSFDSGTPSHQGQLGVTQKGWLAASHVLLTAEHAQEYLLNQLATACDIIPEEIPVPMGGGIPNPLHIGCLVALAGTQQIASALLLALTIVYEVLNVKYEMDTLGPDAAIYGYQYSQATYINAKKHNMWSVEALKAINQNMLSQHKEMKEQLQVRHKEIANHVGEDIADAQNALGEAIVNAQNQLGQGIVDAQNALGTSIVDVQNANGQAIVDASNYVTLQHNKLSTWLYKSLCTMFESMEGSCETFIGPLEEEQVVVPVELFWPEGQPTMLERFEQIQTDFASGATTKDNALGLGYLSKTDTKSENIALFTKVDAMEGKVETVVDKVDTVEGKVDAVKDEVSNVQMEIQEMQDKGDTVVNKVDAVKDEVSNVQMEIQKMKDKGDTVVNKVDAVKVEVSNVQMEIREMKDMMSRLFELMGDKLSKE